MLRIEEMNKEVQEESKQTPPDISVGEQSEDMSKLNKGEREAMEAIKKFTDEDDKGEISIKSILGGDFLMSGFFMRQVIFVMFCVGLMLLYTGNRYSSQQDAILIDSLRSQLQDVKYNVLTQSSELMNMTRQSNVEKALRNTKDSVLQNPITPPYLIRVGESNSKTTAQRQVREVLVDSMSAIADTTTGAEAVKTEKANETNDTTAKTQNNEIQ